MSKSPPGGLLQVTTTGDTLAGSSSLIGCFWVINRVITSAHPEPSVIVSGPQSPLDCSFIWFWYVLTLFQSWLRLWSLQDSEVSRSLLWLLVELALIVCGGLASICCSGEGNFQISMSGPEPVVCTVGTDQDGSELILVRTMIRKPRVHSTAH